MRGSAYQLARSIPWAITEDGLRNVLAVANREGDAEAVAAQLGKPLTNTRVVSNRDGVAVVPITGPIFRRGNMFTEISGATSLEMLARDFTTALNDPTINAIVLDVDSPGGEVNGVSEFAAMIYAARSQKRITAYVSSTGASAAYWLAAAATEIVCGDTAILGSIGVIMTTQHDGTEPTSDIEFISNGAERKRSSTVSTAGRNQIQETVDDLFSVFVSAVARYRGVSEDTVRSDFGRGGVFVGQQAVAAGLADRIGSLEGVIADAQSTPLQAYKKASATTIAMAERMGIDVAGFRSSLEALSTPTPAAQAAMASLGLSNPYSQEKSMSDTTVTAPLPPPVTADMPPLVLPMPSAMDPALQAQFTAYASQMQSALQGQLQEQYAAQMKAAQDQAALQFERWKAEQVTHQQITAFVQDATTGTLERRHALSVEPARLTSFLTSLSADTRKEAQAILTHVLEKGFVSFEELGSSAEGEEERDAKADWEAEINAKVAKGMARSTAITAVMKEKPALYAAYSASGTKKGGK